ncbi:MAG: chemotaxis protein CheD [Bacteroidota bacterium]|nr:chemotaxis protein CheD [Bacteroidota bacterium]
MNNELPVHYLYPSCFFVSKTPYLIHTILGSCVAICLYDPILKIGGMNHYMLPLWKGSGDATPKYGDIAIDRLLNKMLSMGSVQNSLVAKVFGGGEVITTSSSQFNVGEQNVNVAYELLKNEKINIVASSVGGKFGRRIQFNTSNGTVLHKIIEKQDIMLN